MVSISCHKIPVNTQWQIFTKAIKKSGNRNLPQIAPTCISKSRGTGYKTDITTKQRVKGWDTTTSALFR